MFSDRKHFEEKMGFDKEIEIDVGRWVRTVLQKWWLLVVTTLCGFGIMLLITHSIPTTYTAKAVICSDANMDYEEAAEILYYLQEYAAIGGDSIAERACLLLGNDEITAAEIAGMIGYSYETGKITMSVEATSENSQLAVDVANAVAESFVIEAQSMTKSDAYRVLVKASLEDEGVSEILICILGALVGLLIPIIIIVIKQMMSDKIYYVSDATLGGKLEIIGIIPEQAKL